MGTDSGSLFDRDPDRHRYFDPDAVAGAGFGGFGSVFRIAMYSGYVVAAPPLAASTGTP
jgi:hypothetical protein